MPYTVSIDKDDGIIVIQVSGPLDNEVRKQVLSEIATRISVTRFDKVVVDLTQTEFHPAESMIGALSLTKYMNAIGIGQDVRLAFLYSEAEGHRRYFQNIAQSVGYNIRYFRSRDDAMTWLNE